MTGSGVNLVGRNSFVPDLRTSKEQGQANFVNPGLFLYNVGADFELTPKLKLITNVSYLQFTPYTDRMDYLSACNSELAWSLTVEKLLGVEAPERAQWLRVIVCELNRIASHLIAFGTYGNITFEALCLGVPFLVVAAKDFQADQAVVGCRLDGRLHGWSQLQPVQPGPHGVTVGVGDGPISSRSGR